MKMLLLASSLFLSANVFAIDANSSWDQINASYKTDVRAPQVGFAAGEATTFYSIFETCVDGDTIKTIEPKDVYEQVRHGKDNVELVVVGQEVLSHPRTYKVMVPAGDHGNAQKEITITIPAENQIDVYSRAQKDNEAVKLFTKSFTIPACK